MPGQIVEVGGRSATFVGAMPHPIWPVLRLVIWKMDDGEWSHDALDSRQWVGEAQPSTSDERLINLSKALLGEL
jgi:hypothetical protein